jgi:hypothetical protein
MVARLTAYVLYIREVGLSSSQFRRVSCAKDAIRDDTV